MLFRTSLQAFRLSMVALQSGLSPFMPPSPKGNRFGTFYATEIRVKTTPECTRKEIVEPESWMCHAALSTRRTAREGSETRRRPL